MQFLANTTSPYVRKCLVTATEVGVIERISFQVGSAHPVKRDANILAHNPLGKVPCLVMEGGEALFDPRVIVEYLDTLSPVGKLIPPSGRERAEVKTWEALADGVLDAAILARLEATWPGRKDGERSEAWIERQMKKIADSKEYNEFMSSRGFGVIYAPPQEFASFMAKSNTELGATMKAVGLVK